MAFSLLPREDTYFVSFSQMSEKIIEAAGILVEMTAGAYEDYDAASKRIKSVEHECDELTHSITTKLNKSFITPFDREDIYTLAVSLDDICDYIDAGFARHGHVRYPRLERLHQAVCGNNSEACSCDSLGRFKTKRLQRYEAATCSRSTVLKTRRTRFITRRSVCCLRTRPTRSRSSS